MQVQDLDFKMNPPSNKMQSHLVLSMITMLCWLWAASALYGYRVQACRYLTLVSPFPAIFNFLI